MFNWKKHCFIWLSLLSFPLLSTFIQQPVDAYTIKAPEFGTTVHDLLYSWESTDLDDGTYLRPNPGSFRDTDWISWMLRGWGGTYLSSKRYSSPQGTDWENTNPPPPTKSTNHESYGDIRTSDGQGCVLAVGGWDDSLVDNNFRFLTIDLRDFVNLQAVGRNAFENLGHQEDAAKEACARGSLESIVTEITVPDKCTQIEEHAWKYCTFLKKVTFLCPNITYISPLAFEGCYDTLEEVRIATTINTKEELAGKIEEVKNYSMEVTGKDITALTDDERIALYNQGNTIINSVADFVATFEAHGWSYEIEEEYDEQLGVVIGKFIVLTRSPGLTANNGIDISGKENVLKENLVYSSKGISVLRDDLRVTAPDGTVLPNTDYDIYLRWVKDGETSEWVKYENKDSLKVRDPGTYTIQYVVYYKGDDSDLKSNPEGLEVNEDESGGIQIEINENEDSSEPTEVSEPTPSEDDSQTQDSSSEGGGYGPPEKDNEGIEDDD